MKETPLLPEGRELWKKSKDQTFKTTKKVFTFPNYFYFSSFLVMELFSAVVYSWLFIIFQLGWYSELVRAVYVLYLIHGHASSSILKTASAIAAIISSQLLGQVSSWWCQTNHQQAVPGRLALFPQGLGTWAMWHGCLCHQVRTTISNPVKSHRDTTFIIHF